MNILANKKKVDCNFCSTIWSRMMMIMLEPKNYKMDDGMLDWMESKSWVVKKIKVRVFTFQPGFHFNNIKWFQCEKNAILSIHSSVSSSKTEHPVFILPYISYRIRTKQTSKTPEERVPYKSWGGSLKLPNYLLDLGFGFVCN